MRHLIAIFGICFLFTTCKKYPDDEHMSLKKPTKRLVGSWRIIDYTYDGSSAIDMLNTKLQTFDIRDLKLLITKEDLQTPQKVYFDPYFGINALENPLTNNDTQFNFNKTKFITTSFGDSLFKLTFLSPMSLNGSQFTNWTIKKLYKSEMNLELNTDSGKYVMFFKK